MQKLCLLFLTFLLFSPMALASQAIHMEIVNRDYPKVRQIVNQVVLNAIKKRSHVHGHSQGFSDFSVGEFESCVNFKSTQEAERVAKNLEKYGQVIQVHYVASCDNPGKELLVCPTNFSDWVLFKKSSPGETTHLQIQEWNARGDSLPYDVGISDTDFSNFLEGANLNLEFTKDTVDSISLRIEESVSLERIVRVHFSKSNGAQFSIDCNKKY